MRQMRKGAVGFMDPLISIVMVNYNKEMYIEEAIKSVLEQTYTNWELIIVDDGSTDDSVNIIRKYQGMDDRIKAIFRKENSQICVVTNIGFGQVKGEFVARIDSDDVWLPQKLEKQLAYLEVHPEGGLCFTKLDIIDENSKNINDELPDLYKAYNSRRNQEEWIRHFFFCGNTLIQSSLLMKREVLDSIGNFNVAYMQGHDFDFFTRAIRKYQFIFLEEPLTWYRRTGNQNSGSNETNDRRFFNENMNIRYHYFDDMEDELFIRCFHGDFVNPESVSHEEILCEQAFLLCKCIQGEVDNPVLGLTKLERLLNDPRTGDILQNKFGYCPKDYYKQSVQKLFYTEEVQKKINILSYDLNVQMHINKSLEAKNAELYAECEELKQQVQGMLNSRSWRVTKPLRKVSKMVGK